MIEVYGGIYPTESGMRASNRVGQVWRFLREIQKGDLVVVPLKTQSGIAVGEVKGDYEYKQVAEHIKHIRRVEWLKIIPRSSFDQDILYSFGAIMTVCKIERNNAEVRAGGQVRS